jgi:uncharacterized Zn finger protein (UPF0148 family)
MKKNSDDNLKKMAELLLSKATMLQYHCSVCGSPLFKKDNSIFCHKCGEVILKEEKDQIQAQHKEKNNNLLTFMNKVVCVKTLSELYRGKCEHINNKTFTVILTNVEKKHSNVKTGIEEWISLSNRLFIQGDKVESIWLEEIQEEKNANK